MSEGAPPKNKRNGARSFKNPPQPHMCIRDQLINSEQFCYVNVLSWDKVDMPTSPNMPVPMYGTMPLTPPRTEDKNTLVYAVIVNTEFLKMRGKNCKNSQELASLVEVLLNFVESMNEGVKLMRKYEILKDRDIIGELKEVWITVQNYNLNQKDKENTINQQETWIDGQPSVPQYPQTTDQQQQQQLPQQPPSVPAPPIPPLAPPLMPPLQQMSQQHIQNQQMMQNSYMMQQPPQYTSSVVYNPISNECSSYDRYNYSQQNQVPVSQNDQLYQNNQMMMRPYNNGNGVRHDTDRYKGRGRGRGSPPFKELLQKKPPPHQQQQQQQQPQPPPPPPPPQQQQQQQNCPAYLASQYLFQQYALDSNMAPSYGNQFMNLQMKNLQMNQPMNHYPDYLIMQHQHMATGMEQRQMESQMHAEAAHRMQQQHHHHHQQQQEQMHMPPPQLMQQPAPQYQPSALSVIASHAAVGSGKRNFHKFSHMGGNNNNNNNNGNSMQKNNIGKRPNNSPTHVKQGTPLQLLQRSPLFQNKQVSQSLSEKNLKTLEKNTEENKEASNVQLTDIDEKKDAKIESDTETLLAESTPKKPEALNYAAALKDLKDLPDNTKEAKTIVDNATSSFSESSRVHNVKEVNVQEQNHHHHYQRPRLPFNKRILRPNSYAHDAKISNNVKFNKSYNNNLKSNHENNTRRFHNEKDEDQSKRQQTTTVEGPSWNANIKQKSTESPKRAQSTVNSIIKSVFKIHQGNNATGDDATSGKKHKSNGLIKPNAKGQVNEHEDTNQSYTILKKSSSSITATTTTTTTTISSSSGDVVVNEIAQLSIQDCKDTTEINAVLS